MSPHSSSFAADRRVLVALTPAERDQFFPDGIDLSGCEISIHAPTDSRQLTAACREFRPHVLLSGWSTPRLSDVNTKSAGGSVAYVCHLTGTVRRLVSEKMLHAGLVVTNWGNLIAPQVAEHALLLIMGALRSVPRWPQVLAGQWEHRAQLNTRTLHGKFIGVYGFGAIAQELLRLLAPFKARVEVFSAGVPDQLVRRAGATPVANLQSLALGKDIFVCCEALTPRTRHSLTPRVLAGLRGEAVFCNIGRGALVQERAWWPFVESKRLRLASDVFEQEPLSPASQWLRQKDAFISPHIGGPTHDSHPECGAFALRNVRRFFARRPLHAVITPELFVRST